MEENKNLTDQESNSGTVVSYTETGGQFRKKPVIIEAIKWSGCNPVPVANFMKDMDFQKQHYEMRSEWDYVLIKTLEGDMKADKNDWIIKGINGEFYPCKPDIFLKTYEPVSV